MKTHFSNFTRLAIGTFVCLALVPLALNAQTASPTSYLPILQATDAGDLGLALSNPTLSEVTVTLTARTYSGETISGADIANPATVKLPPSGQRAQRAVEIFGNGIAGKTGWIEVKASSPAVKGFFLLFDSRVSFIDGGEMQSSTAGRLIFPKVTVSATTSTNITFVHTGTQTVRFASISLYDNSGKIVTRQYISLGPQSGFSGPINQLVPSIQNFEGYAVVETAGTPFSGVIETLIGFETYREKSDVAALNAVPETTSQRIGFLPHLASQAGYRTTLSFVNYSFQSQTVKITASGLEANGAALNPASVTVERTIPAFGRLTETADKMFGLSGNALIAGYVKWEVQGSTPGLIGALDYGTVDGILLSAVSAQTTSYSDLFFSHIAEGQGYYTGLAFLNPNANGSTVNIEVFNRDGKSIGKTNFTLTGGERRSRLMRELIPAVVNQLGGYVRVTATRPVFAFQLFGSSSSLSFLANVSAQGIQLQPQASGRTVSASTGATVVSNSSASTIAIPPGALDSDTVITLGAPTVSVPAPSSNEKVVASVEALPSGTQFKIPVTLTIPLAAQLDPGTPIKLLIFDSSSGTYTDSGFTAVVDDSGRTAAAQVTHFTTYVGSVTNDVLLNVTGISPNSGRPASPVTIGGSGFSTTADNNIVTFAGPDNTAVRAAVTAATATSLTVTVPATAVTGSVIVRVGTKSSIGVPFTVEIDKPKPSLSSISPTSVAVATSSVEVKAIGTGFHSTSVMRADGVAVSTTIVDATLMLGTLSGAAAAPGIHRVSVFTPPTGGGESEFKELTIGFPVPTITSIAPTSAQKNTPTSVTITGTGFTSSSSVLLDSAAVSSTFVSPTTMQASFIGTVAGNRLVVVSNPAPGGGQSNAAAFTFTEPAIPPVSGIVLITGSGSSATVATTVPLTVELRNPANLPFASQSAEFMVTSGNGSVSAPAVSDQNGRITVTVTLGTTAGLNRVLITAGSASATFDVTGVAAAATRLTLSKNPASFAAGSAGSSISARIEDQYGNLRTGNTDAVGFAITSGTGNLSVNPVNAAGGIATVTLTSNMTGSIAVQGTSGTLTAGSTTVTVTPGAPATMPITGGNNQTGQAGVALPVALKVQIKDAFNNNVPGVTVTFSVLAGGGSVSPLTAITDANGEAQTTATPGSLVGAQTFRAAAAGLANSDFTSTIAAGPAKSILLTATDSTRVAGVTTNLTVTVRDQFGNTVLNAANAITLTASPSASVTFGNSAPSLTNGVGTTTFAATTVNAGYTITAASAGLTSGTGSVAVTTAAAANLVVASGNNQTTVKGTALPNPLIAKVTDQFGNAVSGVGVTFAATSGGGSVSNTASQNTSATGQVSVNATLGNVVGTHEFTATSGTLTGSPLAFSATATNAPPASITQTSTHNAAAVNTTQTFSVVVKDANNNTVSLVNVNFAVTAGNGSVQSGNVVSDANGVSSTVITLGQAAGTNTFTATVSGLAPVTLSVTGNAGAITQLVKVSGDGQTGNNGAPLGAALVVKAADQYGNAISGASVTFTVTSGSGSVSPSTAQTTPANGQVQVTATLGVEVATHVFRATSGAITADFSATATQSPATTLTRTSTNNAGTVNTTQTFTVKAADTRGNPVPGVSVTFARTAGNGSVGATPVTTDASGNASTTITLSQTAGANTYTAAATGLTTVTLSVTGNAGAVTTLTKISGDTQTGNNGSALGSALVVEARDQFANPVSGASVTFTVTSGGGSVNPSTAQTTPANGQVQVTATLGVEVATHVFRATSGAITADFSATATQSPATTLTRTSTNNAGTVNTTQTFTVKAADTRGNPVPGVSVTFAKTAGNGSVGATPVTTDASGNASTTITLSQTAGANTYTAAATGLTTVTLSVTGNAGAVSSIAKISGDTQTAGVGTALANPLVVEARDQFNNPVSGVSITFTATSGAGTVNPVGAQVTPADGRVQVTATLGSTVADYVFRASDGTRNADFTATGTLIPATITLQAGNNQTVAPGIALLTPPKVRVLNAGGVAVPNATVNWAVASGGGSVSAATSLTDSNGDAVITATVGSATGTNTFTATVGSLAPVTFTATSKTLAISPVSIDVAISSGAVGVGSYSLQINFNKDLVQLTAANIVVGTGSGYSITAKNLSTPGVLILNGFSTDVPAGNYTVARITFTPIRPGTVNLTTQDVLVTDVGGLAVNSAFLSLTSTTLTIN